MKVLVLPIKPVFAYRVLTRRKKFDLRKLIREVHVKPGDRVVMYVSGRIKAFMGEYTVGRVIRGTPDYIVRVLSEIPNTGVSEEDFNYIKGAKWALAMEVLDPLIYKKPIELKPILRLFPDYQPPMGIQELDLHEPIVVLVFDKIREQSLRYSKR